MEKLLGKILIYTLIIIVSGSILCNSLPAVFTKINKESGFKSKKQDKETSSKTSIKAGSLEAVVNYLHLDFSNEIFFPILFLSLIVTFIFNKSYLPAYTNKYYKILFLFFIASNAP